MRLGIAPITAVKPETTFAQIGGDEVVTVTTWHGNTIRAQEYIEGGKVVLTTSEPLDFRGWKRRGNARKTAISTPTVTTYSLNGIIVGNSPSRPLRASVRARWRFCSETAPTTGASFKAIGSLGYLAMAGLLALAGCDAEPTPSPLAI